MSLTPFNFPVSDTAQVVLMLVMASPSLGPNVHFSMDPVHMNSIFKKHERLSRNQQALLQHRFLVLIEIDFFSLRDPWQTQQLKYIPLSRRERSPVQTCTPESSARHKDQLPYNWDKLPGPLQSVFYMNR